MLDRLSRSLLDFTTILDFGTNVFSGTSCWLQIGVRPAGALVDFVGLQPRQGRFKHLEVVGLHTHSRTHGLRQWRAG